MNTRGFAFRWLAAIVLVFLTYNPTGYSFVHWIWPLSSEQAPLKTLAGLALLVLYIIFMRATFRSIGVIGIGLIVLFVGAVVWLFVDQGWMDLKNPTVNAWILIFTVGTTLGIGVSWSFVRRKMTGQFDTDDVDE